MKTPLTAEKSSPAIVDPRKNFPLENGDELLVELAKPEVRMRCTLAGMEKGVFLLVKLSPVDFVGTFRSETVIKAQVTVKFQRKDVLYGFTSQILNIVANPCKLMFISFPAKMEAFTFRPKSRHECAVPAMAMLDNEIIETVIADISAGGCLCQIKTPERGIERLQRALQIDRHMEIRAQFKDMERSMVLRGRIRNIGEDKDIIKVGVMFENLTPELKAKLDCIVSAISPQEGRGQATA